MYISKSEYDDLRKQFRSYLSQDMLKSYIESFNNINEGGNDNE